MRLGIAGLAVIALGALAFWSTNEKTITAPARVEAVESFTIRHAGDGRVRWTLQDGSTPGVAILDDGILQSERGDPISVRVTDGLRTNATIESGQALVEIHSSRTKEELAVLTAELEARKADAALLEAGARPERIAVAQRGVEVARANLADAKANQTHRTSLAQSGAGAQFQADEAARLVRVREAELARALAEVENAKRTAQEEEVSASRARIDETTARLEEAKSRSNASTVKSPISGRVAHPGGVVVLAVLSSDTPVLPAAIPEMKRSKINVGDSVEFTPYSNSRTISGTVLAIGADAQPLGAELVVWVVTSLDEALPLGATGTVKIHCESGT